MLYRIATMRKVHTIKKAALLAGLTPDAIRAWERRYSALTPDRSTSNRRLYTDDEVDRLVLLRKAIQSGHRIGKIAGLPVEELRELIVELHQPNCSTDETIPPTNDPLLAECLLAIERLDPEAFEHCLTRAASKFGTVAMLDRLVGPLVEHIGLSWRNGKVRIASEHMATAILRAYLMRTLGSFKPTGPAPYIVVTTPSGQHHEFGALLVAVTASLQGWRVLYLGPNLPAEEIAGAAQFIGAQAVALSIVYPPDDLRLPDELLALRRYLGNDIPVLVGGRDAGAYSNTLVSIGAQIPEGLQGFRTALDAIQSYTKLKSDMGI